MHFCVFLLNIIPGLQSIFVTGGAGSSGAAESDSSGGVGETEPNKPFFLSPGAAVPFFLSPGAVEPFFLSPGAVEPFSPRAAIPCALGAIGPLIPAAFNDSSVCFFAAVFAAALAAASLSALRFGSALIIF